MLNFKDWENYDAHYYRQPIEEDASQTIDED